MQIKHNQKQFFLVISKTLCFAVQVVPNFRKRDRAKVLKEVEVIHRCGKHENIVEMLEFFEESDM